MPLVRVADGTTLERAEAWLVNTLAEGLEDFVTVADAGLAEAIRKA